MLNEANIFYHAFSTCVIIYIGKNMKIDLMCENYRAAAINRRMVKEGLNIEGYLFIEALVRNWPHKKRLPEWLLGTIPSISKHEARNMHPIDIRIEYRYYKPDGGFAVPFKEWEDNNG